MNNEAFLMLVIGSVLLVLLILGIILWRAFTPEAKRRRAIRRQAQLDFRNARGAAHLRMLLMGRDNLTARLKVLDDAIKPRQQSIEQLNQEEQAQLLRTLERQIADRHIQEIPGIGEILRESLLVVVDRGKMSDLRYAQRKIHGIGEAKQGAIDRWIKKWEDALPEMLAKDFPRKTEIQREHLKRRAEIEANLKPLALERFTLGEILVSAEAEINKLSEVKASHLAQAMLQPGGSYELLDHYLTGVFPEWEPMPDWFKKLVSIKKN